MVALPLVWLHHTLLSVIVGHAARKETQEVWADLVAEMQHLLASCCRAWACYPHRKNGERTVVFHQTWEHWHQKMAKCVLVNLAGVLDEVEGHELCSIAVSTAAVAFVPLPAVRLVIQRVERVGSTQASKTEAVSVISS